jgi:hypothetical protein
VGDGQPHKSNVRLCGNEGQSDAEWIGTLKDAIRKLEANREMAAATRNQIIAAITTEIGRLSVVGTAPPPKRELRAESSPPLSRDYAALPPMPATPPPAAAPVVPVASPAQVPAIAATPAIAPPPISAMPRLRFSCETPGDLGGSGPCAEFERETRLTIQADGAAPAGTTLQFVRNGREQGEVTLDGLAKGAPLRTGLPGTVCAGFGAGRLELRVVRAGGVEPEQTEGPYSLRC